MSFEVTSMLWLGLAVLAQTASTGQPPPDYSKGCTETGCHDEFSKRAIVHNPVETGVCDACHEPVDGEVHKFRWVEEGGDLCLQCHEFDEVEVGHQPVAEGQCTVCHDPHASAAGKLLTAGTVAELCEECHDDVTEDIEYLHGPVAAGACTACHNAHGSDHSKILIGDIGQLCTKCHIDMKPGAEQGAIVHEPAKEGCDGCHAAHGSDNRMFLSTSLPELCLDCHDAISELLEDATATHDAVTEGKSCVSCHSPHAAKIEHLLRRESMELCVSCHDKPLDSTDGKILNIAQHLSDNPNHHGPIQDEDCTTCHNPHGGSVFRLLTGTYPAKFYSAFDEEAYGLCFDCHEVEMVEEEETDEATGFRNGEQNLHYLHVNRPIKGRTCRACHDVHASKQPKHIRIAAPFGEWAIPINFEQDSNGGSCQPGCHRRYRYDRETPVGNVSPP